MLCFLIHPWRQTGPGRQSTVSTDGWLYRLLVALSGITLILVVAYIILAQDNRSIQAEVNRRQQFINQGIQLSRVNEALIRALTAAANTDEKLRDLLAQNGITTKPPTGAPASSEAPTEKQTAPESPAPVSTVR
jgi:hypothetical protein